MAGAVHRADDRGLMTLEMVLWTPFLMLALLFVVAGGRIVQAGGYAQSAAADAARAASLQRDDVGAQHAAADAAERVLADAGISCSAFSVILTGGTAPGQAVTVTVRCTTPLSDLAIPGFPGQKTLESTASSPIERTRG